MNAHTTAPMMAHAPSLSEQNFATKLARYKRRRAIMEGLADDIDPEEDDAICDAYTAAERQLVHCPAVTIHDLRAKIEVLWDDPNSIPHPEDIAAVFIDLRRLCGDTPSRTFGAEGWLRWFERVGGGWVERDGDVILLYPADEPASNCQWTLATRGGLEAVKAAIRARSTKREA